MASHSARGGCALVLVHQIHHQILQLLYPALDVTLRRLVLGWGREEKTEGDMLAGALA